MTSGPEYKKGRPAPPRANAVGASGKMRRTKMPVPKPRPLVAEQQMPDACDLIERTADYVRGLLSGEGSGHDWFHVERVRNVAVRIAQEEQADLLVVELAGLLHDVAGWKFAGGDHDAGPRAARQWLESLGVPHATIEHVAEIIASLSFKGAGVATPMR